MNERVAKVKRFKILLIVLTVVFCSFALFGRNPYAQDDEVIELRRKVTELEKRVKELEGLLFESGSKNPETLGWQNKKNWRRLETGMDQKKVKDILGEPIKIIQGVKTLWYYPNIYCGYCSFDEKGHLVGWNEP